MEEATDGESVCGELVSERFVHFHRDEHKLDHRSYSSAQCLCRSSRLRLPEDMDQISPQISPLHSPGEHCDSNLRCRFRQRGLHRYTFFSLFFQIYILSNIYKNVLLVSKFSRNLIILSLPHSFLLIVYKTLLYILPNILSLLVFW